ncbi:MAG: hypothetical protein IKS55_02435 [Oscillospiraceae bacterium]|nr:hypothetical protein [Oscillospiraceae bacterium]
MPRYEITKSLIESWYYVQDCWEGGEEEAMNAFMTALRREKEDLTEEQQQNINNGFEFEKLVTDIATGAFVPEFVDSGGTNPKTGEVMGYDRYPRWHWAANEFAQLLRGAQFQVRIHKPITVRGIDFEIHGVLDALREGTIFDIKFKNKSFGSLDLPGSYLDSAQHPFYFYLVPEARRFLYLVSDGTDVYIEQYTPEESRDAYDVIAEFVDFLQSAGLMDLYKEHWAV